jgi:gamma-glutamylcyclotransferase
MDDGRIFYFAYGSNADPERFRSRVGAWRSLRTGRLLDHRLRFASSVRSEGGGGAVVDPEPGSFVAGVVFEITVEQIEAMDREEFDARHDLDGSGRRVQRDVQSGEETLRAELYVLEDDGGWLAPSETYLGFIVGGLAAAGHGLEALERVRAAARKAEELERS